MLVSDLIPEAKRLTKLGARKQKPDPVLEYFRPKPLPRKPEARIKPDVDYHPDSEREPQAPNYTTMWIDHFSHYGDVKNPEGSPMESGA